MSAVLADRIAQEHAAAADVLSPAVVSAERRQKALHALAARGLPTTRDENWRYANLRLIERVRLAPSVPRPRPDLSPDDLPAPIEGHARYTFVDGVFAPELSRPATVAGVSVASLRSAQPVARASASKNTATDEATAWADARFALLNDAFATDGAVIDVAPGGERPACIEVVFVATEPAQTAASYPRLHLDVQAGARLGLIERHISLKDDSSFVNGAVHVSIARDARVTHHRLQQAGARSTWFDTLTATVEQNARYDVHAVSLGALSARTTLHIQLVGARAELGLHVVSLADRQQVHDALALVEHIAPHTKSEQSVRGIAGGRARVAFNSKVVVREGGHDADSRQSLRGLLAGAQAEIDVRPQLEIYTDDVRCSHGATAGKLDDTMLFYLLSRGIDRDTAQQLLKWAFLEDVVSRIAVPELRRYVEASLAGQMQEKIALKELI